jgi:hypothetical protein
MTKPESLRSLFEQHEGKVADKWSLYLDVYDRVLAPYRDRPITFVEVGVQNGGSLEIWAKYFASARFLIGCDIDPACAALAFDDPRISIVIGPVNSPPAYREILSRGPIDVFIDDGSHRSHDIINSFCNYFRNVRPGGIYIIEDLHCAYFRDWGGGLRAPTGAMGFLRLLVDGLHHSYWKDEASFEAQVAPYLPPGRQADVTLTADIGSIAFFDSICVIEKRSAEVSARLGMRVVAGQDAAVDRRSLELRESQAKDVTQPDAGRVRPAS